MIERQVGIIDYGVGNLKSVFNALSHIGANVVISSDPSELLDCASLILPGVGAFPHALQALKAVGLENTIGDAVESNKPLLGICVGMQLLTEFSTEFQKTRGLGLISGSIESLQNFAGTQSMRLPNVGWSSIKRTANVDIMTDRILENIPADSKFYFIHSYGAANNGTSVTATAKFGPINFAATIASGKVVGTQFHPEKSGPNGLILLKIFLGCMNS